MRKEDRAIIAAYVQMALDRITDGFEPFLVTLMFEQLGGAPDAVAAQMYRETERAYATMVTRIIRNPRSRPLTALPMWIVCPDFPVFKHERDTTLRDATVNDGRHLHAVALVPPWSRMKEGLVEHVETAQGLYSGAERPLHRLHAVAIDRTPGIAAEYVMKAAQRGRIGIGEIMALPRSSSEL